MTETTTDTRLTQDALIHALKNNFTDLLEISRSLMAVARTCNKRCELIINQIKFLEAAP